MKILVADDEIVSRKKTEWLINNLGYEAILAEDGLVAWDLWRDERPRIVLTDWMMPGMDGVELCKLIRKHEGSQYTYIIMVTAKRETDDIVSGIDAGADDFISKPFVKEELAVRIRAGERMLSFETRDIVIFAMARLAESRDSETGYHLERIRFYSKVLSETLAKSATSHLDIDKHFLDNIFLTSPLHDIGKVGIPDHILLKPGKLNEQEFEIMKTHSVIGYRTLSEALQRYPKADYLKMSAEIALHHHEKFNGTGYPHGLKGNEIPLAARIVALSDVYDALISKRAYKEAYPHEKVRTIIKSEKGTHFDPLIVDAFLACETLFIDIHTRFRDT